MVAKINTHSNEHIDALQKNRKKGSGRRKPSLDAVTEKYYKDDHRSVVVISSEMKMAIAKERLESGKTERQIVAEALIQYLGLD